jgi:hypothetical protein
MSITDTQLSHLKGHLDEVMAVLRMQSMDALVQQLICSFAQENYRFGEFIFALANYTDSLVGWEEVTKYLELAAEQIPKIRSGNNEETTK